MPATIVLGAQWGDEGKGRVVDYFAAGADYVVRYQGGNNAGHTIIVGDQHLALSLIPSGIHYPDCIPVIASGTVIDPKVLIDEMDKVASQGLDPSRVRLSANAHLIMPYHRKLDAVMERYLGRNQIGTTKRGIGPAYTDKYARSGIRVQDLFDEDLQEKVEVALERRTSSSQGVQHPPHRRRGDRREVPGYAGRLRPTSPTPRCCCGRQSGTRDRPVRERRGRCSTSTAAPIRSSRRRTHRRRCSRRLGIGPGTSTRWSASQAYISRVGTGPFPTELHDADGDRMIELGGEYGTVTGRRRRCGWLDLVALRYAARVNGLSHIFMTKLDILSAFETVKVAVGYREGDTLHEEFPAQQSVLYHCAPEYVELPGWGTDITGVREYSDLPANAAPTSSSSPTPSGR